MSDCKLRKSVKAIIDFCEHRAGATNVQGTSNIYHTIAASLRRALHDDCYEEAPETD